MFFVSLLFNQMLGVDARPHRHLEPADAALHGRDRRVPPAGRQSAVETATPDAPQTGSCIRLGVVLATQNPVDLDYKGLSNIGTWFLGRLQTERDKARVLDGLEGAASGGLDRAETDRLLSALGKRVFMLHNVHEHAPRVFQTRWTMSYLRGPLSRDQIRTLMANRRGAASAASVGATGLGQGVGDSCLARRRSDRWAPGASAGYPAGVPAACNPGVIGPVYSPVVLGAARIAFTDTTLGSRVLARCRVQRAPVTDAAVPVDWSGAAAIDVPVASLLNAPEPGASFQALPAAAAQARNYPLWQKAFAQWLGQKERVELLRHRESGLTSRPGETERDFKIRVQDASRSARDKAVAAVSQKYAAKQATLAEQLRKAEASVGRESEQATQQKLQTALSVGATLVGALFGRKMVSAGTLGRATTAARGVGRSMKESSDVQRASDTVEAVRARQQQLEAQIQDETKTIAAAFEQPVDFEHVTLVPKRGQVTVQLLALGWDPE